MEMKKVIICSVVGFLGLLSAALGFAAEAKRIKVSQIKFSDSLTCIFPSSPALGLGLGAAGAILIAQIIVSIAIGCFCSRRGSYWSNYKWIVGLICFFISWVTFVNAFRLLLLAAIDDGKHKTETNITYGPIDFVYNTCSHAKAGVFAGGAVLSLATAVFGIAGYHFWDSAAKPTENLGGIAMGRPQYPTPNAPAIVHEDIYMRQQYA